MRPRQLANQAVGTDSSAWFRPVLPTLCIEWYKYKLAARICQQFVSPIGGKRPHRDCGATWQLAGRVVTGAARRFACRTLLDACGRQQRLSLILASPGRRTLMQAGMGAIASDCKEAVRHQGQCDNRPVFAVKTQADRACLSIMYRLLCNLFRREVPYGSARSSTYL